VKGYEVKQVSKTHGGYEMTLSLVAPTEAQFGEDIKNLKVSVEFETVDRFHIKITDADKQRWELPESIFPLPPRASVSEAEAKYQFSYIPNPFSFAVTRKSDGAVLFDSNTLRSLVFKDLYVEISNKIPTNANIYGLGERVHSLRLDPQDQIYSMFTIDSATPTDQNLYGAHPFYLEMRDGKAHGVFLKNSNAQEVFISSEKLTYYLTGGVLDFYVFVGPQPEVVVQQYQEIIGKPYMPPFWSLGWHQCRYGFRDLDEIKTVVQRYAEAKIPLDTIWADIDYMEKYMDFTWDAKNFPQDQVKEYIDYLHGRDQKMVVIVDPGILNSPGYEPFEAGRKMNVFIKNAQGEDFIGRVWPHGPVTFPDFFHPNATEWWFRQIKTFLDATPVDGLWIDMNEASNFCTGDCRAASTSVLNNPPYKINNNGYRAPLNTKTLDMDAVHYGGLLEYDVHSLFGFTESIATRKALERYSGKRSFVLTRSTFAGSGHHVAHWLGDNHSTYQSMRDSLPGAMAMNILGIPMIGADICGFTDTASEQLCARWHAVGVFFPFARNHNVNDQPDQYPYTWPSVQSIAKKVLTARYSLLPYYYTLFAQAHLNGGTVMRPLFFEFPEDDKTLLLDQQFMIGSGLLFSPNLYENAAAVNAYFPKGVWYDFWTYERQWNANQFVSLAAPLGEIPIHIRGGTVLPRQVPALTTAATKKNPFELVFALDFLETARGQLFLDDGDDLNVGERATVINFSAGPHKLSSQVTQHDWVGADSLTISRVTVLGVYTSPAKVLVDGVVAKFTHNSKGTLVIDELSLPVAKEFVITWDATVSLE